MKNIYVKIVLRNFTPQWNVKNIRKRVIYFYKCMITKDIFYIHYHYVKKMIVYPVFTG